jgi:hypothetical protein
MPVPDSIRMRWNSVSSPDGATADATPRAAVAASSAVGGVSSTASDRATEDAVSAGSVGPWQPGGISPFQERAGRELAAREDAPTARTARRPAPTNSLLNGRRRSRPGSCARARDRTR